jgi:putative ABC transport system permease protein
MSLRFAVSMAWRESRFSRRRLALITVAIALGVAAVVAINSFRTNLTASIHEQARSMLGADVALSSRRPFPPLVAATLDSAERAGVVVSRATRFASMALVPRTGRTRLVQVHAVSGAFPFYGAILTDPPDRWATLADGRRALLDPGLLLHLDARVGDTLALGAGRFVIAGVLTDVPGEVDLEAALAPRLYIAAPYLTETGLVGFGSLVRHQAFLRLADEPAAERFANRHATLFRAERVRVTTVAEQEQDVTQALGSLARYLGLLGLMAVVLGAIGVASAIHVFVKDKTDSAAVLRCLGAPARTVFGVYLVQALVLGLLGAAAGVALGLVVQASLPAALAEFLPVRVSVAVDGRAAAAGFGVGLWVTILAALLPLLAVRRVTPLLALRRDFGPRGRERDPARLGLYLALAASILVLSALQAPTRAIGIAFAVALGSTVGLLWLVAWLTTHAARRFFPRRARYVVRQGVANLFRPRNQTVAVTLALGFGVFVIATLYLVQRNLLDRLSPDARPDRGNLVILDIQRDQRDGVVQVLRDGGHPVVQLVPIVAARIAALRGRPVDSILADTSGPQPDRWAVRHQYRNTYRDTLVGSERLVAGRWWTGRRAAAVPRVSLEEEVARDLGVGVGDRITWDVQGIRVATEIASLRRVQWARLEPNFFAVFEPGALEAAPQTYVALTRVADATQRAALQRDLVLAYPNLSALDLGLVLAGLDRIFGKVAFAIRFMAAFTIVTGILVLAGAILTTRWQRARETVLLRTIGATVPQVRGILLTEYVALGTLAALSGVAFAGVAGWALVRFVFELPFRLGLAPLAITWLGVAGLTTAVGFGLSGGALRRPPLEALREL